MREIGQLSSEQLAKRFSDFLLAQDIEASIIEENDGWRVWVHDDDELDMVRNEFLRFKQSPADATYDKTSERAKSIREEQHKIHEQNRYQEVHIRKTWQRANFQQTPVTTILIALSVVVALLTALGERPQPVGGWLSITDFERVGNSIRWFKGLIEVQGGQIWRLVTPIFLHYGLLHLIFNMLWLHQLGAVVENHLGRFRYVFFVLAVASASNLCQHITVGPNFGGMSGVDYALLGYVWIKGQRDPGCGLGINSNTMLFMLGWLALGFLDILPMANGAHLGGLVAGVAYGWLPSNRQNRRRGF
jgi:GlpG protein